MDWILKSISSQIEPFIQTYSLPLNKTLWRSYPRKNLIKKNPFGRAMISNHPFIFHFWKSHSYTKSISSLGHRNLPIRFRSPSSMVILIIYGVMVSFLAKDQRLKQEAKVLHWILWPLTHKINAFILLIVLPNLP